MCIWVRIYNAAFFSHTIQEILPTAPEFATWKRENTESFYESTMNSRALRRHHLLPHQSFGVSRRIGLYQRLSVIQCREKIFTRIDRMRTLDSSRTSFRCCRFPFGLTQRTRLVGRVATLHHPHLHPFAAGYGALSNNIRHLISRNVKTRLTQTIDSWFREMKCQNMKNNNKTPHFSTKIVCLRLTTH